MKPVLLLVDLQNDFLATPDLQPPAPFLIERAAALLRDCRGRGIPVIHIRTAVHRDHDQRLPHWKSENRWMCVRGTSGYESPAALAPVEGEAIIHKSGFNSFHDGSLAAALRNVGCDAVILSGVHLHACVRTAAAECLERGLPVVIAEDATGSNDPIHAAACRRWLADRCVRFEGAATAATRFFGPATPLVHCSPRETNRALFEVSISGEAEVEAAVAAAAHASATWQRSPMADRQRLLEKVAERIVAASTDLVRRMAIEIGKPIRHGAEEICRTAENLRDVARRAAAGVSRREGGGVVRRRPHGVVALISPWNNPIAIPFGKIAPALVYGNTVVWKPSPAATGLARELMKLLGEAGVPEGTVQLLTGDHTTAQRLCRNKAVRAVTFTGSLQGGHAMQEICATRMIPLQAELSGNNAAVVWTDANLAEAAARVAWGAFAFAGQRCTANRRVIVHESQLAALVRELKNAGERLPWGDPLQPEIEIGPVISMGKREEIRSLIARGERGECGSSVEILHSTRAAEAWIDSGAYVPPAIVTCPRPDDPLVQEETMGPLLVVQPAADFDHALALCNGVRHGLAAALFTTSSGLQQTFLERVQAGVVKFNGGTAGVDVTLPFGGWKASGIGPPEHGEGDCEFYTRWQAVYGAEAMTLE